MTKNHILNSWLFAFLILSILTWGYLPVVFMISMGGGPSEGVSAVIGAWSWLAYFTYIPWALVLLLLTFIVIGHVQNIWVKIGIGLVMTPILIIAGLYSWLMGAMGLNIVLLKKNAPIAYYISKQEPKQSFDISHFFAEAASKSDILALLSESGYNRGKMSNEAYDQWYEESLAKDPPVFEYRFGRSITCVPSVARMGTKLRVKFDENDKLVSATGYRAPCYM